MKSLLVLISLTLFLGGQAQDNNLKMEIAVKGQDGEALTEYIITINSSNGESREQVVKDEEGRSALYLDYDLIHECVFQRAGHQGKTMIVNTQEIPEKLKSWGYEFGGINITLPEGDGTLVVGYIYFDLSTENFEVGNIVPVEILEQVQK